MKKPLSFAAILFSATFLAIAFITGCKSSAPSGPNTIQFRGASPTPIPGRAASEDWSADSTAGIAMPPARSSGATVLYLGTTGGTFGQSNNNNQNNALQYNSGAPTGAMSAPGAAPSSAPRFGYPEVIRPVSPGEGGSFSWPWKRSVKPPTPIPGRAVTDVPPERPNPQYKQSPQFYSKSEELWIISRPVQIARAQDDQYPGSGALLAKMEEREIPLPLKHTDVKAKVAGYIATVDVTQQFQNPYESKIEAIYVFPLPENSAVNEFVMTIGERHIRGIIRERAEAEQIYRSARQQGYVASLLTQERPNIFTQSVANIEPGKQIDVNIRYYNTLSYMDGWFEFVFPMVVGPRFNPPGSTDGVGAVHHSKAGTSGQKTEVTYLKPNERSAHDIDLEVQLEAGVPIEMVECLTHKITQDRPAADKLIARLDASDRIPNRDFVLRYRVTGDQIKAGVLTHRDERGGYFTMMLYPPAELNQRARQPMEMVFVLDCSGSMSGRPIAQAKDAIRAGLKLLEPRDSFQLINFSMSASQLGATPLAATPENIQRALEYLNQLNAEGGTMMIEGIKGALDFPHDPERLRFVCFLTDGYIGNESDILSAVQQKLGPSRIFSFGVGPAVNRYLLDGMARIGRGAVGYFLPQTDTAEVMKNFFERISHPALTDLQIDWVGMKVHDVYPKIIPDLFAGRPIILTGRFDGATPSVVNVRAHSVLGSVEIPTPVFGEEPGAQSLAPIWARAKIADLSFANFLTRGNELQNEIRQTALDYSLLSQFTAFVAVDSTHRTAGAEATTVPVAVPVPKGVNYRTTVPEN